MLKKSGCIQVIQQMYIRIDSSLNLAQPTDLYVIYGVVGKPTISFAQENERLILSTPRDKVSSLLFHIQQTSFEKKI